MSLRLEARAAIAAAHDAIPSNTPLLERMRKITEYRPAKFQDDWGLMIWRQEADAYERREREIAKAAKQKKASK